jgi:hypothetical protein
MWSALPKTQKGDVTTTHATIHPLCAATAAVTTGGVIATTVYCKVE